MHAQATTSLTSTRLETEGTAQRAPRPVSGSAPALAPSPAPASREALERSAEEVAQRVEEASRHLERLDRRLRFEIDDTSGRLVVAIIDSDTSEVIKQIPAEEMLEVARRLDEQLLSEADPTGLLLSDEA